ncbi:hypothetical protein EBR57_04000 [bacterium]|nr:hypothetical protein [bacterium]
MVNQNTQDQGRFAIETTSGDPGNPSDNEQSLIYGRPIPWTSYTTLRIDDDDYIFGGPSRKLEKRTGKELQTGTPVRQVTTDDRIITDFDYDGITARQVLSFFRTPTTRVKDSALIEYEITNKTKKSITLGIRVMLDTKLGSNDGAPFRIGSRAITSEILVPKADLLPYWQTFDSLTAPTVVAQGTLESPEDGLTPPDRLVLANWGTLADNPWAADYQEGRSFVRVGEEEKDTALALMWEPITLRPGQSRRIRTAYGLGGVTLAAGDLSLGLTAPAEATAGSSRDLFVIAYITNTGGFNSRETTATLVLPKGVEVSNGSHIVHLGQLKVGETRQIPFRIKTKSARKGTWPITLKVTSATLAPNQIQRSILLHAPQTATASVVSPPTVDPALNRYIEAQVIVTNPHESPLESVVVSLKSPAQPWFEIPSKSIPILPPGKTVTLDWQIGPISSKTPTLNLEVFISSFGMDPEKVGQQVDVTNGPSILTGKLSQPSYKVGEFGYITLCGQPGQNVSGELRIEGNALRALRITKDEWAKSVSVSTTPEALIFSNAMIPATRSGSILRWHFKAVTSGNAAIHIISDRGTTTIPITITD